MSSKRPLDTDGTPSEEPPTKKISPLSRQSVNDIPINECRDILFQFANSPNAYAPDEINSRLVHEVKEVRKFVPLSPGAEILNFDSPNHLAESYRVEIDDSIKWAVRDIGRNSSDFAKATRQHLAVDPTASSLQFGRLMTYAQSVYNVKDREISTSLREHQGCKEMGEVLLEIFRGMNDEEKLQLGPDCFKGVLHPVSRLCWKPLRAVYNEVMLSRRLHDVEPQVYWAELSNLSLTSGDGIEEEMVEMAELVSMVTSRSNREFPTPSAMSSSVWAAFKPVSNLDVWEIAARLTNVIGDQLTHFVTNKIRLAKERLAKYPSEGLDAMRGILKAAEGLDEVDEEFYEFYQYTVVGEDELKDDCEALERLLIEIYEALDVPKRKQVHAISARPERPTFWHDYFDLIDVAVRDGRDKVDDLEEFN